MEGNVPASPPTGSSSAAGNGISLREFLDARLASMDEGCDMRMASMEKAFEARMTSMWAAQEERFRTSSLAIFKAEESVNERLKAMNEFRTQLDRQAATFVTRDTMEVLEESLVGKHDSIVKEGKDDVHSVRAEMDLRIVALQQAHEALAKQVWMIAGALAAIQVLLKYLMPGA